MRGCFQTAPSLCEGRVSSPCMRGCFRARWRSVRPIQVFPVCVGVFPQTTRRRSDLSSLPRVCGGVSAETRKTASEILSSPRMRGGGFRHAQVRKLRGQVFPAYAGVFPSRSIWLSTWRRLPRVCGGVSKMPSSGPTNKLSSPRMRGCFLRVRAGQVGVRVFPAYAGVFLRESSFSRIATGLPRLSGGVSDVLADHLPQLLRLPRLCGGVSESTASQDWSPQSSPRMRGCFR